MQRPREQRWQQPGADATTHRPTRTRTCLCLALRRRHRRNCQNVQQCKNNKHPRKYRCRNYNAHRHYHKLQHILKPSSNNNNNTNNNNNNNNNNDDDDDDDDDDGKRRPPSLTPRPPQTEPTSTTKARTKATTTTMLITRTTWMLSGMSGPPRCAKNNPTHVTVKVAMLDALASTLQQSLQCWIIVIGSSRAVSDLDFQIEIP